MELSINTESVFIHKGELIDALIDAAIVDLISFSAGSEATANREKIREQGDSLKEVQT